MRMCSGLMQALFRVEHVVRTITNLGACPGANTPKTNLLADTYDIIAVYLVFGTV